MEQYIYLIGEGENPEGGANPAQQPPNFGSFMPLMIGLFALWYFMVIRPGNKQRDEMAKALSSLDKNDKVLTQSGIYGFVVSIKEDEVVLKTGDQEPASRITVSKTTIARIFRPNDPTSAEKK